ncbi:MAG TPA: TonB-dependent receptor [Pyrinomonadaceae bacterium]|nr:TonB-dependent receptor [Pyrinomonadaceae bacterium]
MKNFRFMLAVVLALIVFAPAAFSQGSTGRLVGTVTDPGGAVIPGATVTAKDNQTGREQTVNASDDGAFTFNQVAFGTYTVTVTAKGYSTFIATDVKVDTNRDNTLNVAMKVGDVKENVTIVAGGEVVNSTNGELTNTISEKQVKELPINGRNPLSLLSLLPGVNPTSSSINGQRSSSTSFTRDGLNVQDNFIRTGGFVQDRPTVDDTGEFTAILQNAGAEFGGSQIVQLVTPRGGQDFHGALYEFNRNSKFTANTFFRNLNNVPRPFLNRNQFGGTISGPMVLPTFGEGGPSLVHGKAFFFFNMELFRQAAQAAGTGTTLLPTARNGTFTYTDGGGVQRTVNVLNGAGLNLGTAANQTVFNSAGGATSVDPVISSRILSQLPTACNGVTNGINFTQACNFNVGALTTRDQEAARFDVQFNDRNAFNFVVKRNVESNPRTDLNFGFQTVPYVFQGSGTNFYTAAFNMTPSSRFSNEIRGGYQRSEPFFNEGGVPSDFVFSVNQGPSQVALANIISNPEGTFRSQGRNTDYWKFEDNASYTHGNHSLRFGGSLQTYKAVALNFAGVTPNYILSTTANPNTPGLTTGLFSGGINATDLARANNLRYLLAGIIGQATVTANLVDITQGFRLGAPTSRDLRYENWSGYAQDQWRVSPALTLNLGLRYELFTPLRNVDKIYLEARVASGQDAAQAALDPAGVYQIVGGNAGGDNGAFFKSDKNNFGPTTSFAWSPTFKNSLLAKLFPGEGKTVLRGGYRVSYNSDEYERAPDNALLNHTGLGSQTINALNGGSVNLRSVLTPRPDLPGFGAVPGNFATPTVPTTPFAYSVNNTAAFNRFGTVFAIDPGLQVPLTQEFNVGIQREIGWQSAFELRYVGSRSNQIVRSIDYNQVNIRDNGFLADFIRAQGNCIAQGTSIGAANPLLGCTNASYNPAIPGSQPLTVFPNLGAGGQLSSAAVLTQIQNGTPGQLAFNYITTGQTGTVRFLANPNTGVANVLGNGGKYNFNALQAEIRRRFSGGFSFAVNYSFQKILADTTQELQNNVDPLLDLANPRKSYGRTDFDRTHTLNSNLNLELPFGRGKKWLNDGGLASQIFGGFQFTSIVNISSGAPVSVRDPRGTLNRDARSAIQPASSSLSNGELKKLFGIFKTPNGVFYINPSVLQATASNGTTTRVVDLTQPLPTGFVITAVRGASPVGTAPFSGQVFFRNAPGSVGTTPINLINGPIFANWNAGVFRNINLGESRRLQLRFEMFNVMNRANFFLPSGGNAVNNGENSDVFNVNGTNFGRLTGTFDPRIIQFGARFDF